MIDPNQLPVSPENRQDDRSLQRVLTHLAQTIERDHLVQETVDDLRRSLQVHRAVL